MSKLFDDARNAVKRSASRTPLSDEAINQLWPVFVEEILNRLIAGKEAYGDGSFTSPLVQLTCEIQQELDDIVGWSFIQWSRLEKMKQKCVQLEEMSCNMPVTSQIKSEGSRSTAALPASSILSTSDRPEITSKSTDR